MNEIKFGMKEFRKNQEDNLFDKNDAEYNIKSQLDTRTETYSGVE